MPWVCDYCKSSSEDGALKCASCGAPAPESLTEPDLRFCPHCKRRLLAIGSPACNHCGRKLPDSYIQSKQAGLQRVKELGGAKEASEAARSVLEALELVTEPERPQDKLEDLVGGLIRLIK